MKKVTLFLVALISLSGPELVAQTSFRPALQKGSMMAGGSMSLGFGKLSTFNFNPEIGFFTGNGFVLGAAIDLTLRTEKDGDYKSTFTQYLVGPFIRAYSKSGVYFDASYSFGQIIYNSTYFGNSDRLSATNSKWRLGIGYATFLNDHVALEPSISYQGYGMENGILDFSGQLVMGLGLSIYLTRKADAPAN